MQLRAVAICLLQKYEKKRITDVFPAVFFSFFSALAHGSAAIAYTLIYIRAHAKEAM